jgi:hypothetical protein
MVFAMLERLKLGCALKVFLNAYEAAQKHLGTN